MKAESESLIDKMMQKGEPSKNHRADNGKAHRRKHRMLYAIDSFWKEFFVLQRASAEESRVGEQKTHTHSSEFPISIVYSPSN